MQRERAFLWPVPWDRSVLLRAPEGEIERDFAIGICREQAEALLEPGNIDIFMPETFSSLAELRLAVQAIRLVTTIPVVAQVTVQCLTLSRHL